MDETERNRDAARRFVAGVGDDPVGSMDLAMAKDCRIRIPGEHAKAQQLQMAAQVRSVFPDGLQMVIHSMIAENDRVVVEAEGSATDASGRPYNNNYLFLMRLPFWPKGECLISPNPWSASTLASWNWRSSIGETRSGSSMP